jgi:biotin carboxyl carrier protein
MENEIGAARTGRVTQIHVAPGESVERGRVLISIE